MSMEFNEIPSNLHSARQCRFTSRAQKLIHGYEEINERFFRYFHGAART